MLEELLNDDNDMMTVWEVEFIESLNRRCDASADDNRCPSSEQRKVLEEIWGGVFT